MLRVRLSRGSDNGAVSVLVAILLGAGVLLGMGALVIDVGAIHAERRELQNGADAAALAIAQECAKGVTCNVGTAAGDPSRVYANANAKDSLAGVTSVCGNSSKFPLPSCSAPSSAWTDCGPLPAPTVNFVEVRTRTLTNDTSNPTLFPPHFARALAGNASYNGITVPACSRAAWGPAGSAKSSLPVTMSKCDWEAMTADGPDAGTAPDFAPPPPYTGGYPAAKFEKAIKLRMTTDTSCGGIPGGFGWLDSTNCEATIGENKWVDDDTGVSTNPDCKHKVQALVGTVIYLPLFDAVNDLNGTNGKYHVAGIAAFYLSGYNLPAAAPKKVASPVGGELCKGDDKCVYGWFIDALEPTGGPIDFSAGAGYGATTVQMVS